MYGPKKAILALVLFVVTVASFLASAHASQTRIRGHYCYQYGDSESLMMAKEISFAMALRRAIETHQTFISSTSILKDFELKQDLVETIASGYVNNIRIIEEQVLETTVCTTLEGFVEPEAVKKIISKKVERSRNTRRGEFQGLVSSNNIKILNYKIVEKKDKVVEPQNAYYRRHRSNLVTYTTSDYVRVVYQARNSIAYHATKLIVDCFDEDGNPIHGTSKLIPEQPSRDRRDNSGLYNGPLSSGEVRKADILLPAGVTSFQLRLVDLASAKNKWIY